jgi:hypothetical protein
LLMAHLNIVQAPIRCGAPLQAWKNHWAVTIGVWIDFV